jgi:hypothetical protein
MSKIVVWKNISSFKNASQNNLTTNKYRLFWGNEGICDLFTEALINIYPEVPQNNVLIVHIARSR